MAFKHWPLVRDVRFAQKCGRYLRGARKRRPDLNWDEFHRVARHFKTDDMGSFPERGFLYQLASDAPADAQVIEIGSWMGASTCFLAAGLKGPAAKIQAVDNFQGLSTCGEDAAWYRRHFQKLGASSTLEIFNGNFAALGLTARAEPVVSDSLAAQFDVFLCHDSGPMHVAAAVGTPLVALFGSQNLTIWRPLSDRATALQPPQPCGCIGAAAPVPCVRGDSYRSYCVRQLTEAQVFNAITSQLSLK